MGEAFETVIAGLHLARELGIHDIRVYSDSMVVASQVRGEFETREPVLQRYLVKVKGLVGTFRSFSIQHVPREENAQADRLAKYVLVVGGTVTGLFRPSIEEGEAMDIDQPSSWMDPLVAFLTTGELPSEVRDKR